MEITTTTTIRGLQGGFEIFIDPSLPRPIILRDAADEGFSVAFTREEFTAHIGALQQAAALAGADASTDVPQIKVGDHLRADVTYPVGTTVEASPRRPWELTPEGWRLLSRTTKRLLAPAASTAELIAWRGPFVITSLPNTPRVEK